MRASELVTSVRRRARRYDMAVVGGGTAGLIAARVAAGLGARVVLIERERTGGDCLWRGCVPSKSLIAAADLAHRMRTAAAVGLTPVEPQIDLSQVMGHVHAARRRIEPQDSPEALRADGVEVIVGTARFLEPGRLDVGGRRLDFRTALVATGSRPIHPDLPGLDAVRPLDNENVWDLDELPGRLVVLGGGPNGCELGQAFARLGSQVTIVQRGARLLVKEEPEVGELLAQRFAAEGIDVCLEAQVVRVEPDGRGGRLVLAGESEAGRTIAFDRLLVAAGRRPDTGGLGLEAIGVETGDRGEVPVDRRLRTCALGVFAAGDVTDLMPFTHVAAYHARTLVANALFGARAEIDDAAVPWVTFTDPEIGRVGLSEGQARERHGERIVVRRHSYADNDRAITAGVGYGFAKLVGDPRGRLIGATVAAPGGGEAIAEMTAWIRSGGSIEDVSTTVHAYPTLAEGPARAADDQVRARWFSPRVRRVTRPALAVARLVGG